MEITRNDVAGWDDLPRDLLHLIKNCLSLPDVLRFSCVCPSWKSISSSVLNHKGRLVSYLSEASLDFVCILDGEIYKLEIPDLHGHRICGNSFGWLVTIHGNSEIQLIHSFNKKVFNLPSLTKLSNPITTELLDEEGLFYQLYGIPDNRNYMSDVYIYKAFTSTPPDIDFWPPSIVVAIATRFRQLFFCRIGEDDSWTRIRGNYEDMYSDIAFYKGDLYALKSSGKVDVFRLDSDGCMWVEVRDLEDHSLLFASDFLGCGELNLLFR